MVVVVSKDGAAVGAYLQANHPRVRIAVQDPPRGTGDAVRAAAATGAFGKAKTVVVLSGDVPLLTAGDGEEPRRRAEQGQEGGRRRPDGDAREPHGLRADRAGQEEEISFG